MSVLRQMVLAAALVSATAPLASLAQTVHKPSTNPTAHGASVAPPAGKCAAPASTPGGADGLGECFPGPGNTGVPKGTPLTAYTGPCTIKTPNTVIDAKIIRCNIAIGAPGIVIKRSEVHGHIENLQGSSTSFRVEDSFVDGAPNGPVEDRAIGFDNFVVLRSNIVGGNGGVYCRLNCTVQDSWIHGTSLDPNSLWHASAIRVEQYATIVHTTLACDYSGPFNNSEIGCSADMSGYADFAPITHNTMDRNLYVANPAGLGYCAYGGGTLKKPYSADAANATYIVFRNNVFQKGSNGKCGTWGAVTDYLSGRTGNVWQNNKWSDGTAAGP